jgi:serine/threonine-protein kinase
LHACHVLDTEPEPAFDDVARLASQVCATPIALVSLVDTSRQWFKARVGLDVTETPREHAFCAHTILESDPMIVEDAQSDPRFSDNPYVLNAPHLRFYAGVPLRLESGDAVGTLCVIDTVPRRLTGPQLDALRMLAAQVTRELSLRRRLASVSQACTTLDESAVRALASPGTSPWAATLDAQHSDPLPVSLGTIVDDRYRVERVLGVGGMGIVVAARDLSNDAEVAIKFIRTDVHGGGETIERFAREARALLRIQSRHVAHVIDTGNLPNGAPFIVMDYLRGQDLEARLRTTGPMPVDAALRIVLEATSGVEAAHAQGVLHRDLKPANLFLVQDPEGAEHVEVVDFGIAKLFGSTLSEATTQLTQTRMLVGSPMYMAPEQLSHGTPVDARSDVWALGVVLYETLTGALPYGGASLAEVCANVLTLSPIPIHARREDIPEPVRRIVARCLQRDPKKRFQTATELRTALEGALANSPRTTRATAN